MEDNKENQPTAPQPAPRSKPSDVDVFLHLLPNIAGSLATKHEGAKTVRDLAIGVAREITGQLVQLGICDRTTIAFDGQYLATPGPAVAASQPAALSGIGNATQSVQSALGNNNGHGIQGAMVAHFHSEEVRKIPTL